MSRDTPTKKIVPVGPEMPSGVTNPLKPIPVQNPSKSSLRYTHSCFRRLCSLWLCLLIVSIAPLVLLTIVLISISFTMEKESALTFSHQYIRQTNIKITNQLASTMQAPPMVTLIAGRRLLAMEPPYSDNTPFESVAPIFLDTLHSARDFPIYISYMYVESEDQKGRAFAYIVNGGENNMGMVLAQEKGMSHFMEANLDTGFFNASMPLESIPATAEDTVFYQEMKRAANVSAPRVPRWTSPYSDPLIPDSFFVTCYYDLFNTSGHWLGVSAIDYTLNKLTDYLVQEGQTSHSSVAYVIDAVGNLIATSDPDAPAIRTDVGEDGLFKTTQIHAEDSASPLIQYSAKHIKAIQGSYSAREDDLVEEDHSVSVPGYGSVLMNFTSFSVPQSAGLDWTIVLVAPEAEFMSQLTKSRIMNASVALGLILLGLIIASCTTCCVNYPLRSLRNEMKKVEKMELSTIRARKSWFYEIYRIQKSFYYMKEKLEQYRAFMPDNIFEDGIGGTGDAEDENDLASMSDSASENVSETSDSKSHHTTSSSHQESNIIADHMALGVSHRRASSLSVKLINASDLCQNTSEYIYAHGALLEKARTTAARTRGTLDNICCDSLHLCFNALSVNKQHPAAALKSALMIKDYCRSFNVQMGHAQMQSLDLSIGIATETIVAGNVGYEQYRQVKVFGTGRLLSTVLSEISASNPRRPLLITREAQSLINPQMFRVAPYGIYFVQGHRDMVFVYEVLGSTNAQSTEWLYKYGSDLKESVLRKWMRCVDLLVQDRTPKVDLMELKIQEEGLRVREWAEFLTRIAASDKTFTAYVNNLNVRGLCTNGVQWVDVLCTEGV